MFQPRKSIIVRLTLFTHSELILHQLKYGYTHYALSRPLKSFAFRKVASHYIQDLCCQVAEEHFIFRGYMEGERYLGIRRESIVLFPYSDQ